MAERVPGYETLRRYCALALQGQMAMPGSADDEAEFATNGLALAERHRVVPLLAAGLALAEKAGRTPQIDFKENLRRRTLALARQTAWFEHELGAIHAALSSSGVACLLVKGPALARQAYPVSDWRVYDDLDLWVERPHLEAAVRTLIAVGYRHSPELGANAAAGAARAGIEIALVHPQHRRLVELAHGWHTLAPSRQAAREIIEEAIVMDISGTPIRTPRPVHALLLACRHGAHHRWDRLAWVADVAGLWQRLSPSQREEVGEIAHRWRITTMVGLGLRLAADVFHLLLDGPAASVAQRPRAIALARAVGLERIGPDSVRARIRDRLLFEARAQDSIRQGLGGLARVLVVPTMGDIQAHPLPPVFYPLYAVLRPLRLLHLLPRHAGPPPNERA